MKLLAPLIGAAVLSTGAALADSPVMLNVLGTWSRLTTFQKHEDPFFNQHLNAASDRQIVGKIQSQAGLGQKGIDTMRMVKNGVFAFGLPGHVAAETAIIEGADLSTLTQDIETQRKVSDAYFPTMKQAFAISATPNC